MLDSGVGARRRRARTPTRRHPEQVTVMELLILVVNVNF